VGEPIFEDGIEIAAAYLFYLCQNHPFIDGNKRATLATSLVFLSLNDLIRDLRLDEDTWVDFTLDVAATKYPREGATEQLRSLIGEKPPPATVVGNVFNQLRGNRFAEEAVRIGSVGFVPLGFYFIGEKHSFSNVRKHT